MPVRGAFLGELQLRELAGHNGEWFCLLSDLTFVDVNGTRHTAPAGTLTNFASIPRPLWSVFPRYGKHTRAAVIHDYGCTARYMSSRQVHDLFKRGLEACGCARPTVLLMWRMVRLFGPRFEGSSDGHVSGV